MEGAEGGVVGGPERCAEGDCLDVDWEDGRIASRSRGEWKIREACGSLVMKRSTLVVSGKGGPT